MEKLLLVVALVVICVYTTQQVRWVLRVKVPEIRQRHRPEPDDVTDFGGFTLGVHCAAMTMIHRLGINVPGFNYPDSPGEGAPFVVPFLLYQLLVTGHEAIARHPHALRNLLGFKRHLKRAWLALLSVTWLTSIVLVGVAFAEMSFNPSSWSYAALILFATYAMWRAYKVDVRLGR